MNNISKSNMLFELYYIYNLYISYGIEFNSCLKLKTNDKLIAQLKEIIKICYKKVYHIQKL